MRSCIVVLVFVFLSLSVASKDSFDIQVANLDLNKLENLQFIVELKKIAPKETELLIKDIEKFKDDAEFKFCKAIVLQNFNTGSEAMEFNKNLQANYKVFAENSYVITVKEKKSKVEDEKANEEQPPRFITLVLSSGDELPLKILKEKFKDHIIEKEAKTNKVQFRLPINNKNKDEIAESSIIIKEISALLLKSNFFNFSFELKPYSKIIDE